MLGLKIVAVGDSTGVILPDEAMAHLKVHPGDTLYLTEIPAGYLLTSEAGEFGRQIRIAEQLMEENRELLRDLTD